MSALRMTSIEETGPRADLGPVTFEKLAPGGARWHPYADLFPWIEGAALAEFDADIAANGVRQPIVFLDGKILDGRNRYMAARKAGIDYPRCDYIGSDPLGFVVSLNLKGRRHLTESQRAMIAAKLANLGVGRPAAAPVSDSANAETPPIGGISTEAAAQALNVGARSIERAKTVREHGAPELVAAVERGDAAVAAAEAIARLPQERQEEILDRVRQDGGGKQAFAKVAKKAQRERLETKKDARAVREEILGKRIRKMPYDAVGIVLEDFEWDFEVWSRETGTDRHASNHYTTAEDAHTAEEIVARRPLPPGAAKDLIVFSWTTAPHLGIAMDVLKLRGLRYVSHFAWLKSRIITGYWNRGKHELLLISTRGNPVAPGMLDEKLPSWLDALEGLAMEAEAERRTHSAKPEIFAEWIERLWPHTPKIELNRVGPARSGWLAWGNQAEAAPAPVEAADPPPDLPLKGGGEEVAPPAHVVSDIRRMEILADLEKGHASGMWDSADPDVAALIAFGEIKVSAGHRGRLLRAGRLTLGALRNRANPPPAWGEKPAAEPAGDSA